MLRIVAGVERLDAGDIWLDGALVASAQGAVPAEERNVGLMFQDFALFPHLKVADNVSYGLRGSRAERKSRVMSLLKRVGLSHYADAYPHVLSGGEQQRVALARALAPKPRVMLMDEPFSGLDERLRDDVRDDTLAVLRDEGAAVLLVTHDPKEAMRMGDHIALMREGRIVQHGTPSQIYSQPSDLKSASFFSYVSILEGIVKAGSVMCPLGAIPAPGLEDGRAAHVVVRPQYLHLGKGIAATVTKSRYLGLHSELSVVLESGNVLDLYAPGAEPPMIGAEVRVSVEPEACFVFPM